MVCDFQETDFKANTTFIHSTWLVHVRIWSAAITFLGNLCLLEATEVHDFQGKTSR